MTKNDQDKNVKELLIDIKEQIGFLIGEIKISNCSHPNHKLTILEADHHEIKAVLCDECESVLNWIDNREKEVRNET